MMMVITKLMEMMETLDEGQTLCVRRWSTGVHVLLLVDCMRWLWAGDGGRYVSDGPSLHVLQ